MRPASDFQDVTRVPRTPAAGESEVWTVRPDGRMFVATAPSTYNPWKTVEFMRGLLIGIALAGLGACASAPDTGVPATTKRSRVDLDVNAGTMRFDVDAERAASYDTIFLPPASAWETLPQSFARHALPVASVEPATRTILSQARVRRELGKVRLSRIITCGSGLGLPKADNYNILLKVMTRVDSISPERSVLRTLVTAIGHDPTVVGNQVDCPSTGWLEPRLANDVQTGRE